MKKIFLFIIPFVLFSCSEPHPLLGQQSLDGKLEPASISAIRRGSHLFKQNGQEMLYLESSSVNLKNYEFQEVNITGLVEVNTNPDTHPVMLVSAVKRIGKSATTTWELPSYNIALETPALWNMLRNGKEIQFFLAGQSKPVMQIGMGLLTPTGGDPLTVDNQLAELATNENAEFLTIYSEPKVVITYLGGTDWQDAWQDAYKSIEFMKQPTKPTVTPVAGSGKPCGGVGGILCPDGEWCQVLGSDGIGKCRGL